MEKSPRNVRFFSGLEVGRLCGVVNQTAINWIRNGHLKAFMTPGGQYRVYEDDLIHFLKSRGMRIPSELRKGVKSVVDWSMMIVIDDDVELNHLLKRYFESRFSSYTLLQAFDGFEAGRLIFERHPGFVLLDINLPGVDGNSICRQIKEDPVYGKPFVISITGMDRPDIRETILANGADAFFPKPLDFERIAETISDFAEKVTRRNGRT